MFVNLSILRNFRSSKKMNQLFTMTLAAFVVLMVGCEAQQAYESGCSLLQQGQYDQAIARLKESIALAGINPAEKPNDKFVVKLNEAKRLGSQWHFQQAKSCFNNTDLGSAVSHLEKAIEYDPGLAGAAELLEKVNAQIAQAQSIRNNARQLYDSQQYDQAVAQMEQALKLYRSMPEGIALLNRYKKSAYDNHLNIAAGLLKQDDKTQARAHAELALTFVPDGSEAKAMLHDIKNRIQADELADKAQALMQQRNFEQALELLEQAYKLYPTRPDLPGRIRAAKEAVCDTRIALAEDFMQKQNFAQALRTFRNSKDLLADYGGIDERILLASSRLAELHFRLSAEFKSKALPANSLLHDVLVLGYQPENYMAKSDLNDRIDEIKSQLKYVIGFTGFDASEKNKELAATIEAAALQHINGVKPPNVQIMDRIDLKKVMDELNLNLTDLVDEDFRIEGGRLRGVDAIITGQLLENKVLSTRTSSSGTTTYQSGTKLVANPDYDSALKEYNTAMQNLQAAQNQLNSARANAQMIYSTGNPDDPFIAMSRAAASAAVNSSEQNLAGAQQRFALAQNTLNRTPQQVSVPNTLQHQYPIYNVTKTAKISCFLKVLDTTTGSIIFADRIIGSYDQSDRFVEPDPARNVPADPLDLPDDITMSDKALGPVIEKMNLSISLAAKEHGHRFMVSMRNAENAGKQDQAVENCIKYLFAYPVGYENTNQMLDYLEKTIAPEKDLINLSKLLQQYCHILLAQASFPARLRESPDQLWVESLKTNVSENIKFPCVLIAVEGRPVGSTAELEAVMTQYGVGDKISISLLSENRHVSAQIELTEPKM